MHGSICDAIPSCKVANPIGDGQVLVRQLHGEICTWYSSMHCRVRWYLKVPSNPMRSLCLEHSALQDTYTQSIFPEFCPLSLKPFHPLSTASVGWMPSMTLEKRMWPTQGQVLLHTSPPSSPASETAAVIGTQHTMNPSQNQEDPLSTTATSPHEKISFCWSCYENRSHEWLSYIPHGGKCLQEGVQPEHSTAKRLWARSALLGPDVLEASSAIWLFSIMSQWTPLHTYTTQKVTRETKQMVDSVF